MTKYEVLECLPIGGGVELGRITRSGRWMFAQANMATRHVGGMCAGDRADEPLRLYKEPGTARESQWLYDNLASRLREAGLTLDHVVRLDQYYPNPSVVDAYHHVRHRVFTRLIPPSTSVVMQRLLNPSATISLEALALTDGNPENFQAVRPSEIPSPRASSGFVPALKAGGFIFIAGQMADDSASGGVPPEATMSSEFVWDGTEIGRQAAYTLKNLVRTLAAAGSDSEHVLRAQVYLANLEDLPVLNRVWMETFGSELPARTVVPTTGFGLRRGIIEINLVAVEVDTQVDRGLAPLGTVNGVLSVEPSWVRARDLLFCSGLMAVGEGGLDPRVAAADEDPFVRSRARVEMDVIIDQLEEQLAGSGASLDNLAKVIQFHTNLDAFLPSARAWYERLNRPVPVSAVEVPGPLAVPGAEVLIDASFVV